MGGEGFCLPPVDRPMTARFVVLAGLLVVAAACGGTDNASGSDPLCRDVALEVGLEFDNPYGKVLALEDVGRVMQRNMGNGAAVGDYDRDGDLDVYLVSNEGSPARLFRNELSESGTARFTDVTDRAGVADHGLGRVAHFADLDGDGWLDLLVVNDYMPGELPPSRLFANRGDGTFGDVTEGSGFDPSGYLVGGAALADFDRDGDLDIYLSYWTRELRRTPVGEPIRGAWPGENRYYENLGGFAFRDATRAVGLGGVTMDTFTAIPHDFDADGDFDLYLTVDHRNDRYYENRNGTFVEASAGAGVGHRGNDMGVAVGDVDGNGTFDLFVTNVYDPQQAYGVDPPGNTMLMVDVDDGGARFTDEAKERGVQETAWAWGATFVDIDLDTDQDLYVVQGFDEFIADDFELDAATASLLLNDGTGTFRAAADASCDIPGDQRTVVPFDYDRDGDPDLLVTQVALPTVLLENTSDGNTLTVALDAADPASAGATVEVTAGDVTMRRLLLAGGSYLAGMPLEAYFGLGDHESADVRVTWVTGDATSYTGVAAGTLLRPERDRR